MAWQQHQSVASAETILPGRRVYKEGRPSVNDHDIFLIMPLIFSLSRFSR